MSIYERTSLIIGDENIEKLHNSKVAIFGVGGVGSYVCEALARCGVGELLLVDFDVVSESNINRQIIALNSTIGQNKVDVMKKRIADINKDIKVTTLNMNYTPENSSDIDLSKYDYVVDAIDTVTSKIELIMKAKESGVNIISSMGTGNKLNPCDLVVTDIYKTSMCPLAKVMRNELKKRSVKKLKVVYSKEQPIKPNKVLFNGKKQVPGSISFVPSTAGLIIASEVVKDLIK